MDNETHNHPKWYLSPPGVLVLLFVVLGPFALPLLYKSPKFNKVQKIVLTIVVSIYTSYLILKSMEFAAEVIRWIDEFQTHAL